MLKKLIGLALPVVGTIVLVLFRISFPLKMILGMVLAQFLGFFILYPCVWKPRGFTLGRLTLLALVVSSVSAAMLGLSSWIAGR